MTEDGLCRIFAEKVRTSPQFAAWIIGRSKFAQFSAASRLLYEEQVARRPKVKPQNWWRHWWCTIPGLNEQRETDIFLTFETTGVPKRFAIHIENKKGDGSFLPGQAEAYFPRAAFMLNQWKYLDCSDFETILIAPSNFVQFNKSQCGLFGCQLSYEEIGDFIPEFRT